MTLALPHYRFTVEQYEQMGQAGILCEDDRVELLDGEIIEMPPIGPRHASATMRLNDLFSRRFRDVALIDVQNPVRLSGFSEPQPDITLLRRREDFYASAHPTPADALLVVEAGDSTIAIDRNVKRRLYARAGIAEYWIVDLADDALIVHREPEGDAYRSVQTLHHGDRVTPLAFPDHELAVGDILGERPPARS